MPMEDEDDFRAEGDLRHLIEAEKIKADKDRLKAAMAKAKEQREALEKVEK
ncbi:MAG TPA: hypothetical protein VMW68_08530 [Methyloceanibacter sp.]|nr:hypothetical protein [Methyloceanibacter sp.]